MDIERSLNPLCVSSEVRPRLCCFLAAFIEIAFYLYTTFCTIPVTISFLGSIFLVKFRVAGL